MQSRRLDSSLCRSPLSADDRIIFELVDNGGEKHNKPKHKSFDCSVMDLSDDIAYGIHDLEDVIALGLIREKAFRTFVTDADCGAFLDYLKQRYPTECGNDVYDYFVSKLFGNSKERKHFISRLVGHFIMNVHIETIDELQEPLIKYRATIGKPQARFLNVLKKLVADKVIRSPNVQQLEFKGQKMVVSVFEALRSDPKSLLPEDAYTLFEKSGCDNMRVICDYVAGMTDSFLLKTYDRLFSPRMGSVFDKL